MNSFYMVAFQERISKMGPEKGKLNAIELQP